MSTQSVSQSVSLAREMVQLQSEIVHFYQHQSPVTTHQSLVLYILSHVNCQVDMLQQGDNTQLSTQHVIVKVDHQVAASWIIH